MNVNPFSYLIEKLKNDLVYKAGDVITLHATNQMFVGRVGWSGKQVWFTIPLAKNINASSATLSFSNDYIYLCTNNSAVNVPRSSFTVNSVNFDKNIVSVCLKFTTAPLSINDGGLNVMANSTITITFS